MVGCVKCILFRPIVYSLGPAHVTCICLSRSIQKISSASILSKYGIRALNPSSSPAAAASLGVAGEVIPASSSGLAPSTSLAHFSFVINLKGCFPDALHCTLLCWLLPPTGTLLFCFPASWCFVVLVPLLFSSRKGVCCAAVGLLSWSVPLLLLVCYCLLSSLQKLVN